MPILPPSSYVYVLRTLKTETGSSRHHACLSAGRKQEEDTATPTWVAPCLPFPTSLPLPQEENLSLPGTHMKTIIVSDSSCYWLEGVASMPP